MSEPACLLSLRGIARTFVQGDRRSGSTNSSAAAIVSATCSAVSTVLVATSMTPTMTVLSLSSPISDSGTRELAHSSDTWSIATTVPSTGE